MHPLLLVALAGGAYYWFWMWRKVDAGVTADGMVWTLERKGNQWRVREGIRGEGMIVGPFGTEAEARGTIG